MKLNSSESETQLRLLRLALKHPTVNRLTLQQQQSLYNLLLLLTKLRAFKR
jgi:hypothetical protein